MENFTNHERTAFQLDIDLTTTMMMVMIMGQIKVQLFHGDRSSRPRILLRYNSKLVALKLRDVSPRGKLQLANDLTDQIAINHDLRKSGGWWLFT